MSANVLLALTVLLREPSGWPSPQPTTHGVFLSDSQYVAFSAAPIESLSDREFDAWLRERQLRLSRAAAHEAYRGWSIARPWPSVREGFVSDSAFRALTAIPIDSLGPREYELLLHERELRALWPSGVRKGHAILMADQSYEELSSTPLDALTARQYDLVTREKQLHAARPPDPDETHLCGFAVFVAALGGFLGGLLLLGYAFAHAL